MHRSLRTWAAVGATIWLASCSQQENQGAALQGSGGAADSLVYRVTYAGKTMNGKVRFDADGKAQIGVAGLDAYRQGSMAVEIVGGDGAAVYGGTVDELALDPQRLNEQEVEVKAVSADAPEEVAESDGEEDLEVSSGTYGYHQGHAQQHHNKVNVHHNVHHNNCYNPHQVNVFVQHAHNDFIVLKHNRFDVFATVFLDLYLPGRFRGGNATSVSTSATTSVATSAFTSVTTSTTTSTTTGGQVFKDIRSAP